jgi:hypothetical protein
MARASATGVEGNTRLTSVTGLILLVMLAVEGATILSIRQLITLHIYLGLLLLGPVVLKSLSTMYRFTRYYGGSAPYVEKGPPHPVLRVLGPLVIVTSLALFGTGVGLVFESGRGGLLLTAHKVSFFAWAAVMTIHVLGHLKEAVVVSAREIRRGPMARGRGLRFLLVVVSLAAGVAVASLVFPSASSWTSHHDRKPAYGAPQSHG